MFKSPSAKAEVHYSDVAGGEGGYTQASVYFSAEMLLAEIKPTRGPLIGGTTPSWSISEFFFILYLSEYIVLPDILYNLVGSQLLFKN